MKTCCVVLSVLMSIALAAFGKPASEPSLQLRAFWVDAFNQGIRTPAEIDELISDIKSLNMNMIIAQVRKRGDAYYRNTTVAPFTEDLVVPKDFDPLEYLIQKAHAQGIQVHAWINAMTLWRAQDEAPKAANHPFNQHGLKARGDDNWLNCDEKGNSQFPVGYFFDPGHPAVGDQLAEVAAEIVRNYRVDGIHLDYIRYPETVDGPQDDAKRGVGYNAVSVRRFNQAHQREGTPKHEDPLWQTWRRQQVTDVVRKIRQAIQKQNPKVLLSAALIPWGDGPLDEAGWTKSSPYVRVFQDWHSWRKEGLLDLCVPMNYDREHNPQHKVFYDHWIAFEKAHKHKSKLIIGIGAYMNSLDDTLAQTRRALAPTESGQCTDGVCYFSYASFKKAKAGGDRPTMEDLRKRLTSEGGLFEKGAK